MKSLESTFTTSEKSKKPFSLERVKDEVISSAKISPDGKLRVNGVEFGNFKNVSNLKKQTNGVYSFQTIEQNGIIRTHFVNPNDSKKAFPHIDTNTEHHSVSVRNRHWNTLDGKKVFSNGSLSSVDPITESIVFRTEGNGYQNDSEVIANNVPWKNTFAHIQSAESTNDVVLAIAQKQDDLRTLYVNDSEWSWPVHKDADIKKREAVVAAVSNGNDTVAVAVTSTRLEKNKHLEHIFVGDNDGAKKEWSTVFDSANLDAHLQIAVDKTSDTVAVFGMKAGDPVLAVNDIICKLSSTPMQLEKLSIDNGVVTIQYLDAVDRRFAEKVTLSENAPEVQAHRKEQESVNESLSMLRDIMHKTGLAPQDVVSYLTKYAGVVEELKREKKLTEDFYKTKNDKALLMSQKEYFENALNIERQKNGSLQKLVDESTQILTQMSTNMEAVQQILGNYNPEKAGAFKKAKIDKTIYNELMDALVGRQSEERLLTVPKKFEPVTVEAKESKKVSRKVEKVEEKKEEPDGFGFSFK